MQLTNKALIATTIELSLTKQDERGQMAAAACCSHPRRRAQFSTAAALLFTVGAWWQKMRTAGLSDTGMVLMLWHSHSLMQPLLYHNATQVGGLAGVQLCQSMPVEATTD